MASAPGLGARDRRFESCRPDSEAFRGAALSIWVCCRAVWVLPRFEVLGEAADHDRAGRPVREAPSGR